MLWEVANDYSGYLGYFLVNDEVDFYIMANDTLSPANTATDDNYVLFYSFTYYLNDTTNPNIDNISHGPQAPTELDEITIGCKVTDISGVEVAYVYYRINNGDWEHEMMTHYGEDYEITIGSFSEGSIKATSAGRVSSLRLMIIELYLGW